MSFRPYPLAAGVELHASALTTAARRVLTPEVVALVARLHRALAGERSALLAAREVRQSAWDAGKAPEYLAETEHPQAHGDWQIVPLPSDMRRRRVEITGPVSDARMVINMLSRGADGRMADAAMLDFEDAMKPSWGNVVAGVENVIA